MIISRHAVGLLLVSTGVLLLVGPWGVRLVGRAAAWPAAGQEQPPNRREFTLIARDFQYTPDRVEVTQDDLVKMTVRSEDIAYTFTVDEYRIAKRVPAGGATMFEFRADRAGSFPFYSSLTSEPGHARMRGQLVVRAR